MDAAEWDTSHDPDAMLVAAGKRLSDRSLLLFACASARRVWEVLPAFATALVPRVEAAADLPTAERVAALQAAVEGIGGMTAAVARRQLRPDRPLPAVQAAAMLLRRLESTGNTGLPTLLGRAISMLWESTRFVSRPSPEQAALLRCVAGNPFAETPFDPAWRTSDVRALAALAAAGAFDTLPILADALQDAGCSDDVMLNHLRTDAGHTRGCWVLDGVLGRS